MKKIFFLAVFILMYQTSLHTIETAQKNSNLAILIDEDEYNKATQQEKIGIL